MTDVRIKNNKNSIKNAYQLFQVGCGINRPGTLPSQVNIIKKLDVKLSTQHIPPKHLLSHAEKKKTL